MEHLFVFTQSGSQASFIYKPKVGDTTDFNFLDFVDILLTYFNKLFSLQVSIQQRVQYFFSKVGGIFRLL